MRPELSPFAELINQQVQSRLVRAQQLAEDARFITSAWERGDVDTLVALGALNADQAEGLRQLLSAPTL
jgi:hypothetical protein